jgi:hypothetical protein
VRRVAAGVLLACLGACSSNAATPQPSAPSAPTVLPAGATDLPLAAGDYLSPNGFVPSLTKTVAPGWRSVRRGDDGFDLAQNGVTVVFATPLGTRVAEALQTARRAATGIVTQADGTLDGQPAIGFDVVGGTGAVLTSPSGTVTVRAAAGQRVRVLGTDVEGVPLVVAVVAPASRWEQLLPKAQALIATVHPA